MPNVLLELSHDVDTFVAKLLKLGRGIEKNLCQPCRFLEVESRYIWGHLISPTISQFSPLTINIMIVNNFCKAFLSWFNKELRDHLLDAHHYGR